MCRVIAVSNQKGGVGKTVSCVNLGIGLAQKGKKVLLIDADPQGSLTISLGYEEPDEMEYSLATLMLNVVNDEKLNMEKTILHHGEGVDLIPANIELSAIEVSLVNAMSRELILRSLVDKLRTMHFQRRTQKLRYHFQKRSWINIFHLTIQQRIGKP